MQLRLIKEHQERNWTGPGRRSRFASLQASTIAGQQRSWSMRKLLLNSQDILIETNHSPAVLLCNCVTVDECAWISSDLVSYRDERNRRNLINEKKRAVQLPVMPLKEFTRLFRKGFRIENCI